MAEKTLKVLICDHCHQQKDDVEKRRILLPRTNRQFSFDACKACRDKVPLSEWEALIPKRPKTTRGSVVVSVEDVQKLAKRRRKAG